MGLYSGNWPSHYITVVWNQDAAHLLMCSGSWACWNAHSTGIMQLDPVNQAHLNSMIRPQIMLYLPPDSTAFTAARWLEFSVEGSFGKLMLLDQHKKNLVSSVPSWLFLISWGLPLDVFAIWPISPSIQTMYFSFLLHHSGFGCHFEAISGQLNYYFLYFLFVPIFQLLLLLLIVLTKYLILNFSVK